MQRLSDECGTSRQHSNNKPVYSRSLRVGLSPGWLSLYLSLILNLYRCRVWSSPGKGVANIGLYKGANQSRPMFRGASHLRGTIKLTRQRPNQTSSSTTLGSSERRIFFETKTLFICQFYHVFDGKILFKNKIKKIKKKKESNTKRHEF